MLIRNNQLKRQIVAGALIGAFAAFFVAAFAHFKLWLRSSGWYVSTGATQGVDLWTYYSMCRAVWRSTNGITYEYPYSLYWPVPAVVFQLPITALAWLGRVTGLPMAFEVARVIGGAGTGAAIGAIGALFPRGFWRRWFYIAAVLGGGFFSFAAIAMAIDTAGLPGLTEPHEYQPKAEGQLFWWLPFLVRNLRMPLECLYHAMVLGSLACLVWQRNGWAWALGAVVWMSNPFSAVALHAAVVPWLAWRALETREAARRRWIFYLSAWLIVNVIAAAYYGWFMNRWILMRELHNLYQSIHLPPLSWWRLTLLVLPYGVGMAMTVFNAGLRRAIWGHPVWRLFAILAVVHIVLMQQSAFLGERSMQAYHYNRGYLHLGLVVIAWRVLVLLLHKYRLNGETVDLKQWWPWKMNPGRHKKAAYAMGVVVLLSMMDQVFFTMHVVGQDSYAGLIEADYAAIVKHIPNDPGPAIVLTESAGMPGSYITAFTPHVAWDADETLVVPFWSKRKTWLTEALAGEHGGASGLGIDYAIVYKNNEERVTSLISQGWIPLARTKHLRLLKAPEIIPGINPIPPKSLQHFPQ